MEPEDSHEFETAEQFWQKLDETVARPCENDEHIDDALRSYIALTTGFPDYVESDNDLRRCAYKLYSSPLFAQHADYIRTQLVHSLLQDEEADLLYITATLLLADAREHEATFGLLNNEGAFQRMVYLIKSPRPEGEEGLHRLLMELLYEMARIQKITNEDLMAVDDDFIRRLFGIIEGLSDNVTDPYHYPVIRVLLVLSEQYMVAAHSPTAAENKSVPLTNKVIKILSSHGSTYKTFGENIILLLNREDETSLQLLTLKLLYLLFTTPSTYEYFYTNDLHVLVDILVRNLLDLPEGATALRHTYLRVLYPLLEHTQLHQPPHYKRAEIGKLLVVMAGGHVDEIDDSVARYFEAVDDTTKRLVKRCQTVSWLHEPHSEILEVESPTDIGPSIIIASDSPTKVKAPPALPAPRKLKKRSTSKSSDSSTGPYLNPHLEARKSSLSMMEMAAQKEKPGVKTPSRNPSLKHGLRGLVMQKKEKPPPPKARRSGWRKDRTTDVAEDSKTSGAADSTGEISHDDHALDSTGEDHYITKTKSAEADPAEKPKKPPPAPKTRRWRRRKSRDEDETCSRPKEPGNFKPELPSIKTNNDDLADESPFSPPDERTLSPEAGFLMDTRPDKVSSVSAALSQAQIQAIHNIEETLERSHIFAAHGLKHSQANIESESPPLQRPVLAPPGQAPLRGVPGPKMELERSPFLSDNDSEEQIEEQRLPKLEERQSEEDLDPKADLESEDEWND
ncbi:hypothetical protein R6Q59_010138 [Mikania micrantha]